MLWYSFRRQTNQRDSARFLNSSRLSNSSRKRMKNDSTKPVLSRTDRLHVEHLQARFVRVAGKSWGWPNPRLHMSPGCGAAEMEHFARYLMQTERNPSEKWIFLVI